MIKTTSQLKPLLMITAGLCLLVCSLVVRADIEQIQQLIADGNFSEALRVADTELAKDQGNVSYRFLKGLILTRQDRLEQARDIFLEITRTNPELPEPYNNLAVIYAALGNFDQARTALEEAINTHPSYATAHENIGDIYAKLASQAYNQALELDGDNNTAKAKLSLVNELFSMPGGEQQILLAEADEEASVSPEIPLPDQAPSRAVAEEAARTPQTPATAPTPATSKTGEQWAESPEQLQASPSEAELATRALEAERLAGLERERKQVALIKETVLAWAARWTAQDIESYLSYYASDFTPPDGRAIEQWREIRRQRLSNPDTISVTISDLVVEMLGNEHAQATFTQIYQSDVYSDRVKKTLLLKLENNKWLITLEQT